MKRLLFAVFATVLVLSGLVPAHAQIDTLFRDYREVYRDTVLVVDTVRVYVEKEKPVDPFQVISNPFRQNWFIFGTGGAHTFRGDYSADGPFMGTVSPDVSIGFGKWFMPWLGLKVEFIASDSRGYTEYKTGHYGYGDWIDGNPGYRKMKTGWLDLGGSAILNLTRLYYGYEGYGSKERMGQWLAAAGIGAVHHLGYDHAYGSDNELSAHLELQYSRFLSPKKNVSLDIKARGLFYQTNFDLEYGQADHAAKHVDMNLGLNVGLTWYLGKNGSNGWRRANTTVYRSDYRETQIPILKVKENEKAGPVRSGAITFFVYFPNDYSGRNDAPQIADAKVNAIDYLAGGIFTQKQYADAERAAQRLGAGQSAASLAAVDLPTESADRDFRDFGVPRGYEMVKDSPVSLSLNPADMAAFGSKAGFYYAPINDGSHLWQYRIDDAALGQQLLSEENYRETTSFGLNSHQGLGLVSQYMDIDEGDELVSFADVYAALSSNKGYISQFTDAGTVAHIREILDNGVITVIQTEGVATSQDNYSGQDAVQVGQERNSALAQNRAATVIGWLTADPMLSHVRSQSYIFGNPGEIRTVNDTSTRGINAKVNRCVKVRIRYMMQ